MQDEVRNRLDHARRPERVPGRDIDMRRRDHPGFLRPCFLFNRHFSGSLVAQYFNLLQWVQAKNHRRQTARLRRQTDTLHALTEHVYYPRPNPRCVQPTPPGGEAGDWFVIYH